MMGKRDENTKRLRATLPNEAPTTCTYARAMPQGYEHGIMVLCHTTNARRYEPHGVAATMEAAMAWAAAHQQALAAEAAAQVDLKGARPALPFPGVSMAARHKVFH